MLVVRILALLVAIGLGVTVVAWAITGNRKYLKVALRLFQFGLAAILAFLALLFFERLLVMV